jgi:D-alanyl-D-alanine carboxypeptidase (penicillin-binding protein 5/6)
MTMVTYLELCGTAQLDSITEMQQEVLDTAHFNAASCAGFYPGELCTVRDLLYALMLPSGADAALTLANLASGSEEAFVAQMNRLAADMGLTHTHFVNSIGLHDAQHVSSVQDIACILRYALSDPLCTEIMSAAQYTTASTYQHAAGIKLKSSVLSRISAAVLPPDARTLTVLGGKTGYTDEAGQCLATYADAPDGTRYVCVVAGCAPKKPMDAVCDTLTLYQLSDRAVTEITRLEPPEPEQTNITETAAPIE